MIRLLKPIPKFQRLIGANFILTKECLGKDKKMDGCIIKECVVSQENPIVSKKYYRRAEHR